MGQQLKRFYIFAISLGVLLCGHAQSVNTDYKTIEMVTKTQAAQLVIETAHNEEINKIKKLKTKIAEYANTMTAIKEAYKASMQNIDGFGQETQMYKDIATTTIDIFKNIPIAITEIQKHPLSMFTTYREIADLSSEATAAAATFVNIVNNGRVSFKIKDINVNGTDDGYNFINRSDRYIMANDVLTKLQMIKYKLETIICLSRFCNGITNVLYALDIDSWCNIMGGGNQVNTIINLYKEL